MKKHIVDQAQKEAPEFVAEVSGLSQEELRKRLANISVALAILLTGKEEDETLNQAKEVYSQLLAPYSDAKKHLNLKIKYLVSLLD